MHAPNSDIWPLLQRCCLDRRSDRPSPTLEASAIQRRSEPQRPHRGDQTLPSGTATATCLNSRSVDGHSAGDASLPVPFTPVPFTPVPFTYVRPPMWPVRILHSSGTIVRRAPISFDSLLADVNANHNPSLDGHRYGIAEDPAIARLRPR
jgi:hypothetical protein